MQEDGSMKALNFPRQRLRCPECGKLYVTEQTLREHMVHMYIDLERTLRSYRDFAKLSTEETSLNLLSCPALTEARQRLGLRSWNKYEILDDMRVASLMYTALKMLRRKNQTHTNSNTERATVISNTTHDTLGDILPLTSVFEFLREIPPLSPPFPEFTITLGDTETCQVSHLHTQENSPHPCSSQLLDMSHPTADDPTAVFFEAQKNKRIITLGLM